MTRERRSQLHVVLLVLAAVGMHLWLIVGRPESFCTGGEDFLRPTAVTIGVLFTLPAIVAALAYWWRHRSGGAARWFLLGLLVVPLVSFVVFYGKAAEVPGTYCP